MLSKFRDYLIICWILNPSRLFTWGLYVFLWYGVCYKGGTLHIGF